MWREKIRMNNFGTSQSQDPILIRGNYHEGRWEGVSGSFQNDLIYINGPPIPRLIRKYEICQWCARRNPLDAFYCEGCGGPL